MTLKSWEKGHGDEAIKASIVFDVIAFIGIYDNCLSFKFLACLNGTYGPNCLRMCMCSPDHESSPCDRIDGTCYCEPGYTGRFCDILGRAKKSFFFFFEVVCILIIDVQCI